jgi:hypothetical protein
MRLKDILNKTGKVLPYIGIYFGISNYFMANEAKIARLEGSTKENQLLLNEINNKQDIIIAKQTAQTKISSLSVEATEHLESATYHGRVIEKLLLRLNDPNISETEKEFIIGTINKNADFKFNSISSANSNIKEILRTASEDNSNNFIG